MPSSILLLDSTWYSHQHSFPLRSSEACRLLTTFVVRWFIFILTFLSSAKMHSPIPSIFSDHPSFTQFSLHIMLSQKFTHFPYLLFWQFMFLSRPNLELKKPSNKRRWRTHATRPKRLESHVLTSFKTRTILVSLFWSKSTKHLRHQRLTRKRRIIWNGERQLPTWWPNHVKLASTIISFLPQLKVGIMVKMPNSSKRSYRYSSDISKHWDYDIEYAARTLLLTGQSQLRIFLFISSVYLNG